MSRQPTTRDFGIESNGQDFLADLRMSAETLFSESGWKEWKACAASTSWSAGSALRALGSMSRASICCRFSAFHDCPGKKSGNHSRTVASMHETGWEQQQEFCLHSNLTMWSEFAFSAVGHCFLCCNQFCCAVMWSLRSPFFSRFSLHAVCYAKYKTSEQCSMPNLTSRYAGF